MSVRASKWSGIVGFRVLLYICLLAVAAMIEVWGGNVPMLGIQVCDILIGGVAM